MPQDETHLQITPEQPNHNEMNPQQDLREVSPISLSPDNVSIHLDTSEQPIQHDDHHHYPTQSLARTPRDANPDSWTDASSHYSNEGGKIRTSAQFQQLGSANHARVLEVADGRGGIFQVPVEYEWQSLSSDPTASVDEDFGYSFEELYTKYAGELMSEDGIPLDVDPDILNRTQERIRRKQSQKSPDIAAPLHEMHALGVKDLNKITSETSATPNSHDIIYEEGDDVIADHDHALQPETDYELTTQDKYHKKKARFSLEDYLFDINRDHDQDGNLEKLIYNDADTTHQNNTDETASTSSTSDDSSENENAPHQATDSSFASGAEANIPPPLGTSEDSIPPPQISPFEVDESRKLPNLPHEKLYLTKFEQLLQLKYNNKAFFIFTNQNPLRQLFIWLTSNVLFTGGILVLIALNCIFLGMYDPLDSTNATVRNNIVAVSEYVFTSIFAVEMFMKMFAMGLILHPYSYFRDAWNILDSLIVFLGLFSILLDVLPQDNNLEFASSLNTLRTIRILRPLRAISTIPALRVLVSSLISSAGLLLNALFLFIFFLWIFSIIGLQLFAGALRQYCIHDVTGQIWRTDRLCSLDWTFLGGHVCPDMYTCKPNPGGSLLFSGVTNFENIFQSMLLVLQTSTLEGWSIIYNACVESSGYLYSAFIFFVIFFCGIFIINMLISVISDAFNVSSQKAESENNESQEKGDSSSPWNNLVSRCNFYYDKLLPTPKWLRASQVFVKRYIVQTVIFRSIINALIILNTIALAMEHHNQSDSMTQALTITNYVFNALFTMEIALKFFAFGLRDFVVDPFNLLDFLIVFFSWAENIASLLPDFNRTGALSAIRIVRLVKIVRLFNSLSGLRKIVNALSKSLTSALMIIALLLLYILIFSLLGMQLYGGKLPMEANGQKPRTNFDSLWDSFLTVFQVISGENWYQVLYQVMDLHWINVLYVVVLYIGGYYIILGLFAAVIIRNIAQERSEEDTEVMEQIMTEDEDTALDAKAAKAQSKKIKNGDVSDEEDLEMMDMHDEEDTPQPEARSKKSIELVNLDVSRSSLYEMPVQPKGDEKKISLDDSLELDMVPTKSVPTKNGLVQKLLGFLFRNPFKSDVALFFIPQNIVRRAVARIVENFLFESFIAIVILVSSVLLAFENPFIAPDKPIVQVLDCLSWVFNIIFYIEAALKIFAYGFVMHRTSYLRRSWWNCLDFFIVALSVFNTFSRADTFKALRSLRTLRSLRALRATRGLRLLKLKALNRVVYTVLYSFKSIFYIMLVSLLFFMIFGIMGVSLYGGKFYSCSNTSIVTRQACLNAGHTWEAPPQNFDNIFNALLTLFEMSTLEGWVHVKNLCVDAVSYDHAPVRDNAPVNAIYAVVFMIFANFIIVNLFVGVLIDRYALLKATDQRPDMNDEQSRWYDVQTLLTHATMESKPPKPKNMLRVILYHIVTTPVFEISIVLLTLLNAVSMSLSFYENGDTWSFALEICNYIFNGIFTIELILKLIAFGVYFFKDPWNTFDFIIQALSLFGIFMQQVLNITLATSIFRTFRVARLFKILKSARGIRALVTTLVMSLPSILNVLGLICVLIFVYSILGVSLFSRAYVEGAGVTYHSNFNTLGNAFITLVRVMTGEQWQNIMRGYMLTAPDCSPKLGNCVDHPLVTVAYFCSFIVLATFIMMNLFVAIILENYSDVLSQERSNGVSAKDIDLFKTVWNEYDPSSSGYIHVISLPKFLIDIGAPLGAPPGSSLRDVLCKIHGLRLYSRYGQVAFYPTLYALAEYEFGRILDDVRRDQPDALRIELPSEKSVRKLYARLYKRINKRLEKGENKYPPVVSNSTKLDTSSELLRKSNWVHISKYFSPVRSTHLSEMQPKNVDAEGEETDIESGAYPQDLSDAGSTDDMSDGEYDDEEAALYRGSRSRVPLAARIGVWRRKFTQGSWRLLTLCFPFLKKTTEERYVTPSFGLTILSWVTLVNQQQQRRNERMRDLITVVNTQPSEVTSYI